MNSTAARTRPRRWIAAEIQSLDPAADYETIWRLTSSYGLNDFALNLVYAHLFPHFYLPPHGSRPLGTAAAARSSTRPAARRGHHPQQPAVVVSRPAIPRPGSRSRA